jgi:hypothetical protein
MPRTRIACPNCRQPIEANVNQLFDVGKEPAIKQLALSGAFNLVSCPHCGYQGNLATPIVYHDPDKELLLTYFPPELRLPVNEQERIIGPIIRQVMDSLPQEKRKGYLLRPQTMFTLQGMVELILEKDGITKEMVQQQQKRLALLQRMMEATADKLVDLIKQEDANIDADFFSLLARLAEISNASRDQDAVQRLSGVQENLLNHSSYGQQVREQTVEFQEAVKSLQDIGDNLTREKLLDLMLAAPTETRLEVLVSLTRPGIDYEFFQMLSNRIDQASAGKKDKLVALREKLLEMTKAIDQAVEARMTQARLNLQNILNTSQIAEAMKQNLAVVDDFFLQAMAEELESARKSGDMGRVEKIRQIEAMVQQASAPPKEVELIEKLLSVEDEREQRRILEENRQEITPEFMETLGSIMAQFQSGEDRELANRLESLYRVALRYSMQMNLGS